jgi:hypothetical protein
MTFLGKEINVPSLTPNDLAHSTSVFHGQQPIYGERNFTEYKGLYVAPADNQDYDQVRTPPRPTLPSSNLFRSASITGTAAVTTVVYPETLGHLV